MYSTKATLGKVFSCAFLLSICMTSYSKQAEPQNIASKLTLFPASTKGNMALMFAFASAYCLYSRLPVPDFKSRFELKKLTNVSKITAREYWENVWYLFYDEWVGQYHKSKSVRILDKNGETVERFQVRKKDCEPAGVCGNIDLALHVFNKSVNNVSGVLMAYFLLAHHGIHGPFQKNLNKNGDSEFKPRVSTPAPPESPSAQ